jgi:abequosyltransferase
MSQLLLSICIPTYNRRDTLEYLLNNIISQLDAGNLWGYVEICISDNASFDYTNTMVAKYQKQYTSITYLCNTENIGFDRNLLQSISMAKGRYCWLFGSDDRFEDGAIETIIKYLQCHLDTVGMTVGVQNYNFDFTEMVANPKFRSKTDLFPGSVAGIYIKLGRCFSFISAQIISKEALDNIINNNDLSGYYTGYIHLYLIAKIVKSYSKWFYLSQVLVGWRSQNDSILELGRAEDYIKRLRLDYSYFDIVAAVFGSASWVYFRHGNQVCSQFVFGNLQNMKVNAGINIFPVFGEVTLRCWKFPAYYIKILPLFLIPGFGVRFIKMLKRGIRQLGV